MKTFRPILSFLATLPLAATALAADEGPPERQALLQAVEKAWDLPTPAGPVIRNFEFKGGTAFEYLQQLQATLAEPQTAPLVVAVPPEVLSDTAMPSVSIKELPLNSAVEKLSGAISGNVSGQVHLMVSTKDGASWVEAQPKHSLITRTFRMEVAELKDLGLEPQGDKLLIGGKAAWPAEPGASATHRDSVFVVHASPKTMKRLEAILMLRAEGYKDLRLQP